MPKTIGILGGMGSWATLKFFEHILSLSEPDEFRIIIDNNVTIPSRSLAIEGGKTPMTGFVMGIGDLFEHGADFVTIPCNSAHYWYESSKDKNWDILNMIEIVSDAVKVKGYSKPLILGGQVTVEKKLYSEYLPGAVYLGDEKQKDIAKIIKRLKKNDPRFEDIISIKKLVKDKRLKDFDCVVLACTELSLLELPCYDSWETIDTYPYEAFDSSYEYAKATVEYARE